MNNIKTGLCASFGGPQGIATPPSYNNAGNASMAGANQSSSLQSVAQVLSTLGNFGDMDVEFILLSLEIQKRDNQINSQLQAIQRRTKLKEAIGKKLDGLRRLKADLQGEVGGGDNEASLQELNNKVTGNDRPPTADDLKQIAEHYQLMDSEFFQDSETGKVTEKGAKLINSSQEYGKESSGYRINVDAIDPLIEKLTDQQQRIGSDTEIDMIKLKDTIDKKSQLTELLSSILKKKNDTRSSVIRNFA